MNENRDKWTADEKRLLKEMWSTGVDGATIASAFPKFSMNQIRGKVRTMRVRRPEGYVARPDVVASTPAESEAWHEHPDSRRARFAMKAAQGAREALKAMGAV